MLNQAEVDRIVNGAVLATLKDTSGGAASSEPTVDADGDDALRVTVVLSDDALSRMMDSDLALDMIVRIKRDLGDAGDERFPYVNFATQKEGEDDGGS